MPDVGIASMGALRSDPLRPLEDSSEQARQRVFAGGFVGPLLEFPFELNAIGHYVTFRAFETTQLDRSTSSKLKDICTIRLPVPGNLGVAYNISYADQELGAVQKTIVDAIGGDEGARGVIGTLTAGAGIGAAVGMLTGGGLTKGLIAGAIGAGAMTAVADVIQGGDSPLVGAGLSAVVGELGTLGSAGAAQFGIARNPHKVVLFESVGFRDHSFRYEFIPQSFPEAKRLQDIIRQFKLAASPSFGAELKTGPVSLAAVLGGRDAGKNLSLGKHFFKYPDYFDIEYRYKDSLFTIGPSVLTSIDVEYHPAGIPSYARNSPEDENPLPTATKLSLNFKETEIVTKENIREFNR